MLNAVKQVTTKKGDHGDVQMEDLTGQTEAVVFPKAFERFAHC